MNTQKLKDYLEENKYEDKFNIETKLSFIYSLICIADKIMKNKLPYKMNTSNLIIITKDNKEYLKDNFESENNLEEEKIKNKIDEQSILLDLSIVLINIVIGENKPEKDIISKPKHFIKRLEQELTEIKSFVNVLPKVIENYITKKDSLLSTIQSYFKEEYPLNGQEKKIIENLINDIPDKEISEKSENISEEESNDNSSSHSSFSSYENEEEEKEEENNIEKEEKIIFKGEDMELKEIQKSIEDEYNKNNLNEDELNFFDEYKDFFQNKNFILTTEAKNRLMLLKNLIELKINILLEGPTGTAKTLSAEIICDLLEYIKQKEKGEKYKKKETIKFNLSSETTIPDLLARYIGSNESLQELKCKMVLLYTLIKMVKF